MQARLAKARLLATVQQQYGNDFQNDDLDMPEIDTDQVDPVRETQLL